MRVQIKSGAKYLSLLMVVFIPALSVVSPGIASASTSSSTTAPSYVRQWGGYGTGNGQFQNQRGIDINQSTGTIYVSDVYRNIIQEFTSSGTYITQWGTTGSGNGQFDGPLGVAINQSTGNIYVVESGNDRVQEFTSSGTYITQWGTTGSGNGQFTGPSNIAINQSTGDVYVTDTYASRVQVFSSSGTYITKWGGYGTGNGQFSLATGIAINQSTGHVYVSDSVLNNIQEFTSNGTFVTQWGSSGSGDGQFTTPAGLTIDQSSGNIYVSDINNNRMQQFTSSGTYITQWDGQGSDNPDVFRPSNLAINESTGRLYVEDINNNFILEFEYASNVAQETIPGTSDIVNLMLPVGSNITSESINNSTTKDGNYNYPLGLLSFTFATAGHTVGATVPVQLTFQTNLTPSQVSPRKYNSATKTYTSIPGAVVAQSSLSGKPALLLSYSITDGGSLDQDGSANGVIVDPVGLATIPTPTIGAPNTGYGRPIEVNTSDELSVLFGSLLLFSAGFVLLRKVKNS